MAAYRQLPPTPLMQGLVQRFVRRDGEDGARMLLKMSRETLARVCAGFPVSVKTLTIARMVLLDIVAGLEAQSLKAEGYDQRR